MRDLYIYTLPERFMILNLDGLSGQTDNALSHIRFP